MYLLLEGRLGVRLRHADGSETDLNELEPGAVVGEMALLTGQARTATVHALADAELLRCAKEGFDRLAELHPEELVDFAKAAHHRLQEVQLATVLTNLFGELEADTQCDLQAELEWLQLPPGGALFHLGDPGQAMYIVVSGRLRVAIPLPEGGERLLGEVAPGETVGELALLSGEPRTAAAVAIRETSLVRLTQPVFDRLLERHPGAMMRLTRLIVERQQRGLRLSPVKPCRALALVPASQEVPLAGFAQGLAESLSAFGPVLLLDASRLDQAFGKEGASQTALDDPTGLVLSGWLAEQETRYRYILYAAEPTWSPWTRRCASQADRLLVVARAEADPTPGPVEEAIVVQRLTARKELVLLHLPHVTGPSRTTRWLAPRQLHGHHHLRLGDAAHDRRPARALAGQAVGLVLSGGGARGFAHVGVLRAIEELGIEVDRIGGTSMGALIGAAWTLGLSYDDMDKLAQELANPRQLFDYTLPFVSLMATEKITNLVQELLGGVDIEDLWRPYFCISSNLARAEPVVHESGFLWKAVRASSAILGVFSPVLHHGDLLVDGGIMNNLPVDIMHDMLDGGPILAVNASPPRERTKSYQFGNSVSGWQVLRSRVSPLSKGMKVPSLVGTLMRTMEINSVYRMRTTQSLAELLIQPDVRQFGVLDFGSYAPIIEAGYQAAHRQLADWQGQRPLTPF
jgi:predicted acylesterase/phospholipase RssA/CRP-like cAMP-binding protein